MIWFALTVFFVLVIIGAFLYVLDRTIKLINDEYDNEDIWR